MGSFRTQKAIDAYNAYIKEGGLEKEGCALCNKPTIHEFTYWRVVENSFPYDKIARVHHMLITKEHKPETEVTEEEFREFARIKTGDLNAEYDYLVEPMARKRSIPEHIHYHLIVATD